jgi:malate/lactate dehydrogenase
VIGAKGVQQIIELDLSDAERNALQESAKHVQATYAQVAAVA